MITCGYCGQENEDGSVACAGCGTKCEDAPVAPVRPPKSKGRRWWSDLRLYYAGYAVGVLLFYFLSFGPVMYFCSKVTTTRAAAGTRFTTSVTVQLPGWAAIAYYPAFELYTTDSTDKGYGRYVSWWIERRQAK